MGATQLPPAFKFLKETMVTYTGRGTLVYQGKIITVLKSNHYKKVKCCNFPDPFPYLLSFYLLTCKNVLQ